jgi:hypothetical protein
MRSMATTAALAATLMFLAAPNAGAGKAAVPAKPKYYFNIVDVKSATAVDDATKDAARQVLQADLAGRPEFTSDLGTISGEEAVVAELKRRDLQGFRVTLKIEELARERKAPRPGSRYPQLAINLKLSVFGTTLPGAKLAFGGEGEAAIEGEVPESRMDAEAVSMIKDVMVQAVKQAVDQAVAKLSLPKAKPLNESRRKKKA